VTPYATIEDLTTPGRFPRALTAEETAAVPTMLEDASFLLSIKVPDLQAAIDNGDEEVIHAAMLLVVTMVKRSLLAQEAQQTVSVGTEQVSQTFGPYSTSVKYSSDSGNLWLRDNELESLLALLRGDTAIAVSYRSPGF